MSRGVHSLLLVAVVTLTACGGASASVGVPAAPPQPSSPEASVPETTLAVLVERTGVDPDVIAPGDVPEAAIFLAAVDQGLAGTAYEGDAFEDPETYLGTAVLFCELLDNGLSAEEILTAYIFALTDSAEGGEVTEADLQLGGVILGAGAESLCPEFVDRLEVGG